VKKSQLRAVCYGDIFDFPLVKKELIFWQVAGGTGDCRMVRIEEKGGYFFLKGKKKLVKIRKGREKESVKKLLLAEKMGRLIFCFPTIKLVGISGNLAIGNSGKDDDIDFFIVTSGGTLWATRFFINLVFDLLGWRRKPEDKIVRNKACFNFFLDEDNLKFDKRERNLFIAHEILQMRPLRTRGDIYSRFIRQNDWVEKYLPVAYKKTVEEARKFKRENSFFALLARFLFVVVEKPLMSFQFFLMRKRKNKEKVGRGVVRFHPEDKKDWVLRKYRKKD